MITVSESIIDFLTGIHGDRKNTGEREEKIFDRAFTAAYKDMSTHTVKYNESIKNNYLKSDCTRCANNRKTIHNAVKEYVKNVFADILKNPTQFYSSDKFNEWHKTACKKIVEINCTVKNLISADGKSNDFKITALLCCNNKNAFSYGQAQKLVNMIIKYLYIFYQCEGLDTFENLKKYAHAPIDGFVLKAACPQDHRDGIAWSKIETYEKYLDYKQKIDSFAKNQKYDNVFLWELDNWPFEQNATN